MAAALGFETDDDPTVCPCAMGGFCSLHKTSEVAQPELFQQAVNEQEGLMAGRVGAALGGTKCNVLL